MTAELDLLEPWCRLLAVTDVTDGIHPISFIFSQIQLSFVEASDLWWLRGTSHSAGCLMTFFSFMHVSYPCLFVSAVIFVIS